MSRWKRITSLLVLFIGLISLRDVAGNGYDNIRAAPPVASVADSGAGKENSIYWDFPYGSTNVQGLPVFENGTIREVIATVGQTAYLNCRVLNLGDRAVSWIRKRDLHILTIGIMTYTNDQRFQSEHVEGSHEWQLKISYVQEKDSGIYECQVSTEPKISLAFKLAVVVSKAKILASNEMYIKSGSDINLTCVARQAPLPPLFIYWYKNGHLINHSNRGGINIITERLSRTSKLVITRATPADSGNYTCAPGDSDPDSITVNVISGENSAAMQYDSSGTSTWSWAGSRRFNLVATIWLTMLMQRFLMRTAVHSR